MMRIGWMLGQGGGGVERRLLVDYVSPSMLPKVIVVFSCIYPRGDNLVCVRFAV